MSSLPVSPTGSGHISRIGGVLAATGGALAAAGVLVAGFQWGSPRAEHVSPSASLNTAAAIPVASLRQVGPNLVPNPGLVDHGGAALARGLLGWGKAPLFRVVKLPGGRHGELVSLPHGDTGGVFFSVPVRSGRIYEEGFLVQVSRLSQGASVTITLEWYHRSGPQNLRSLGMLATVLRRPTSTSVSVAQAGSAPPDADVANVVVNVVRGGSVVVSGPSLRLATRSGSH